MYQGHDVVFQIPELDVMMEFLYERIVLIYGLFSSDASPSEAFPTFLTEQRVLISMRT